MKTPFPGTEKKARSLTKEDVTKIIELLDSGFSQRSIAEAFGVKPQNISDINLGKLWAWHTGRKKEESRPASKKGQAKHYVKVSFGEKSDVRADCALFLLFLFVTGNVPLSIALVLVAASLFALFS